jgi:predicted ATPase/DNA-binding CsgD family transcriptional regulator
MGLSRLPQVSGDRLFLPNEAGVQQVEVIVGSDVWYNWLMSETTRSFTFKCQLGAFTARRERKRHGWYWYAYHKRHGKLHKAYLGKSEEVSHERLLSVAEALLNRNASDSVAEQTTPPRSIDHSEQIPPQGPLDRVRPLNQSDNSDSSLRDSSASPGSSLPLSTASVQDENLPLFSQTSALISSDEALKPHKHNLPVQHSPLIGREQEIARICSFLERPEVRLLTLTGTGGIGKTRLGLQVAAELSSHFADGIYFVPLASIRDPELVMPTVAQTLGIKGTGEQPYLSLLKAYLREKRLLLLLDNFEHIIVAAPEIAELLTTCFRLKILLTSRAPLHIAGEYEFHVPPLAVPDLRHLPVIETLSKFASIVLFMQRAQMIKPDFQINSANARFVAEICVRLDGLPLAIELAAARCKLLPPQALLARLERRLAVLTQGGRDAPLRQQTLRNTLDWSYDLLDKDEQWFFRHLAIFIGGCHLAVFEELCQLLDGPSTPVLDGVTSLLDKNLLQVTTLDSQEPYLMMLETVREYGLECLAARGEIERARRAYADTYCSFVKEADWALLGIEREIWPEWRNREQETWLDWMEKEYSNLRAALDFLLEQNEIEATLQFAVGFANVWFFRGYPGDGRRYMERVVAASNTSKVASKARGWALYYAGWLAFYHSDERRVMTLLEESKQVFSRLGYTRGVAASLTVLGNIEHYRGNTRAGDELLEESLTLYRGLGDCVGIGYALMTQGILVFFRGEFARARSLFEESLVMSRKVGHSWEIASTLHYLGWTYLLLEDYIRARQLTEESLALFKEVGHGGFAVETQIVLADEVAALGDEEAARALLEEALARSREMESRDDIARALCGLGRLALRQGDLDNAHIFYKEALAILKQKAEIPDRIQWVLASCLEGTAGIAHAQGQSAWAVRLLAKADALRTGAACRNTIGYDQALYERIQVEATTNLGERVFSLLWAEGQSMTTERVLIAQGVDKALPAGPSTSSEPPLLAVTPPAGLTRREFEVLRLLAQGLTNVQIAEKLVISVTTVNSYLSSIYSKLGVSSRLGAMRYAIDHHLS